MSGFIKIVRLREGFLSATQLEQGKRKMTSHCRMLSELAKAQRSFGLCLARLWRNVFFAFSRFCKIFAACVIWCEIV